MRKFITLSFFILSGCLTYLFAQDASFYAKYAEKGDKDAMYNLANCYYSGNGGVQQSYPLALIWYEKAAKKGLAEAQFMAAYCYLYGVGTTADIGKSSNFASKAKKKDFAPAYWLIAQYFKLGILTDTSYKYLNNLQTSADKGYAKAQSEFGVLLLKGSETFKVNKDETTAAKYLKLSAEAEDAEGMYYWGVCIDKGITVVQDHNKALELYSKSAQLGYAEAQTMVGYAFLVGDGVEVDYSAAMNYLKAAADQNNAYAIGRMGDIYYYGLGVEENNNSAIDYYKKAVDLGDVQSMNMLAEMYGAGHGASIDNRLMVKYYKMAADLNDPQGQCGLGYCYMSGLGVAKNENTAFSLYMKAAEQKYPFALWCVANCYYNGNGCTQDFSNYIKYLAEAAQSENPDAMAQMAYEYYSGEHTNGHTTNYQKSMELYAKAADAGNLSAQATLGLVYYDGDAPAPRQDYDEAFKYLKMAIANSEFDSFPDNQKKSIYHDIALCYRYGRGTPVNQALASYYEGEASKIEGNITVISDGMSGYPDYSNGNYSDTYSDDNKIVIIESNETHSSYGIWRIQSIEILPDKTLVEMTITPTQSGVSVWYNSDGEYIEDAQTGQKYRMISGTLGIDDKHATTLNSTRPYEFTLTFEVLSKSVRYVNICSGDHYYVKNLKIR